MKKTYLVHGSIIIIIIISLQRRFLDFRFKILSRRYQFITHRILYTDAQYKRVIEKKEKQFRFFFSARCRVYELPNYIYYYITPEYIVYNNYCPTIEFLFFKCFISITPKYVKTLSKRYTR